MKSWIRIPKGVNLKTMPIFTMPIYNTANGAAVNGKLDPDPNRRQNDADPQHRQWRQYPGDELRRRAGCHL
jgi:hypothetical protein